MTDLYINLEVDWKSNKYLIDTNIKEDKIDDILAEYYRGTLSKSPDHNDAVEKDKYNIRIELDLSEDIFTMNSDTGNRVLTYELVREAIGNWEIKKGIEAKV